MYFTRKTETVLTVLATCAGRAGCSLALWEISQAGSVGAEEIKRSVSLLLRHGLLERGLDGRVTLTIDPGAVTLGTILHLTQPNLARPRRRGIRPMNNGVFALVVDAASSNFLRIAEQFTVADFLADRRSAEHYAGDCYSTAHNARP
ncbi:hypothetical protein G6M70_21080 [Agrobacterium tumefaciens]|uniref:Siderophore biosynthesis protein n=1 Tax=Agrobacterium tumefaciens TaxID=358 RepID=A0A2L2LIE8_AGRTU|nr:Rrf2 family transcriptional regulator [Agrobacterium tumefaciens]AVH44114.1 siderophore biosynthesis protein [Agrobacterium tumefaciens]NSY98038.1 hypothetical protein [Agrobacterium tumefaciens]NSZ03809.1 hypothetical protein [Agrobacterium tumefaciens]NSZ39367.1 hypothetical protein [Agrobacterium tumefaciens]NTB04572.1 hypothetical protein [Agrobacterium tumefaciens]